MPCNLIQSEECDFVVQKVENLWVERSLAIDDGPATSSESERWGKVRVELIQRGRNRLSEVFPPQLSGGIRVGGRIIIGTLEEQQVQVRTSSK